MADLSTGEYQRILDLTVAILDNDEPDLPWRLILDEVRVSLASATRSRRTLCHARSRTCTATGAGRTRRRSTPSRSTWRPTGTSPCRCPRHRARAASSCSAAPAVPPEAVSRYRLTPREVAVLTLLGDALTATAIARRLTISPRTVHRHIDSIYRKLRTNDRLATVLRARDEGLLADPNRPSGRPEA